MYPLVVLNEYNNLHVNKEKKFPKLVSFLIFLIIKATESKKKILKVLPSQ